MGEPSFHQAGVNYTDPIESIPADIVYFKKIKSRNARFDVRVMVAASGEGIPRPWTYQTPDATYNGGKGNWQYHLERALTFAADPAFNVVFNMFAGPTSTDKLIQVHDAFIAASQHIQSRGLPLELSLGNELTGTYGCNFAIISLTQTGGVATLVAASPFLTHVGDTIYIYGSNRTQYAGPQTVTYTDGNATMQFNVDPATPNPGTGTLYNVSTTQLQTWFCQTAADIKAAGYNLGPISVGDFNGGVAGVTPYEQWIARGPNNIGGLDYVSIHPYPSAKGSPAYTIAFPADAAALKIAFGDKCYFSEFNISGFSITAYLPEAAVNSMRDMFKYMSSVLGVKRAIVWSWRSNLAMQNSDGTYSPIWGVLVTNNYRQPLPMYNQVRTHVLGRTIVTGRPPATGRIPV